jgi:hypothetical protein
MLVYHRRLVVRVVPGLLPIERVEAVITFFLQGLLSPEQGKVYASACTKRRSLPTLIRVEVFFFFFQVFRIFFSCSIEACGCCANPVVRGRRTYSCQRTAASAPQFSSK